MTCCTRPASLVTSLAILLLVLGELLAQPLGLVRKVAAVAEVLLHQLVPLPRQARHLGRGLLQLGAGVGVLQLQLVLLDGEQLLLGPPPLGCPHCHSSLHLNVYSVCDVCNGIVYCCVVCDVV